mmetsp:Transcript_3131/g.4842  ORF Transcript_3131/g.4842 Transcript_3131/m.4842 type:complete len:82 (+) Transcript_3131:282-527(+)
MLVGAGTSYCSFSEIKDEASERTSEASGSPETRSCLFRQETLESITVGSYNCTEESDVLFLAPMMVLCEIHNNIVHNANKY